MGRKLDFLLCRSSRQTSKLKTLLSITVSRLSVLRNQRQARCSLARSDVAQLLELGQQDRALLRSEQAIKEQNMLDAFLLIEDYCHLLTERSALLVGRINECPDELKESISGLVFTASRCGELPELLKLRYIFASKFGSDFTGAAVELRNNCAVNPKLIQKLSAKQASMESKIRVTEDIAAEKGIKLDLGSDPAIESRQADQHVDGISGKQLDSDVATAAHAAFTSVAHAAAATRASVELSRTGSQPKDPHDHNAPTGGSRLDARNIPQKDDEGNIVQSDMLTEKSGILLDKSPSTSSSNSTEYEMDLSFDDKAIGLDSESIGTREALSDQGDTIYLRPPYQKSNPRRIQGENLLPKTSDDSDRKGGLGYGIVDEHAKYYYTEKLNEQHSSVGLKPVSVRTRRGI